MSFVLKKKNQENGAKLKSKQWSERGEDTPHPLTSTINVWIDQYYILY